MHLLILWFHVYRQDDAIIQYLNRLYFDCKTKLCLIVPGKQGKYISTQEIDINEQDTSFLNCKYEHMIKSGAPHDKVGVQHCLLPTEFYGFTIRMDFYRFSFFGSWSFLNFLETVWVPSISLCQTLIQLKWHFCYYIFEYDFFHKLSFDMHVSRPH